MTHSVWPLTSESTWFNHGSFSGGVTQTTSEGCGSLVLMPGLGCHSFSLTLITMHAHTKRYSYGCPAFQTFPSLLPLWNRSPLWNFPLFVNIIYPIQHCNSLLCYLAQRHKEPKVAGEGVNFQFTGITVVFPDGNIPPFETKILKPIAEHKVCPQIETGSKILLMGHSGKLWVVPLPFLPLITGPENPGKQHQILEANWGRIQPSGTRSSPARYCHLSGAVEKTVPPFCQTSCFRIVGNIVRSLKSVSMSPLLYFFSCEMSFLINKQWCREYHDNG